MKKEERGGRRKDRKKERGNKVDISSGANRYRRKEGGDRGKKKKLVQKRG